jgi:hypothetical protein
MFVWVKGCALDQCKSDTAQRPDQAGSFKPHKACKA